MSRSTVPTVDGNPLRNASYYTILGLRPSTLTRFLNGLWPKTGTQDGNLENVLGLTIDLHKLGEIQAIDATGVNRIAASQHYAKTHELHVQSGQDDDLE